MALTHAHPKISNARDGSELWDSAQRWTSDIDVSLERQPLEHFKRCLSKGRAHGSGRSGAIRGKYLEMAVYDFVAKVVSANGGDVSCITVQVDMLPGYHAEADILVNNKLAILVKTSFRERWKQVDRDAMIMTHHSPARKARDFHVWSVFFAEKDTDGLEQVQKKAIGVERCCFSDITVASVIDTDKMKELEAEIKWAIANG